MAEYLQDILKNQLIELFSDILRLQTITSKQRCILELGRELTEKIEPHIIMSSLSAEFIAADIDNLTKNSDELFNYIFSCLTKKQVEHEFIKESFRCLYKQLSLKDRDTIAEYARQMKRICEKYVNDKTETKSLSTKK
jgi:hypothetical protein